MEKVHSICVQYIPCTSKWLTPHTWLHPTTSRTYFQQELSQNRRVVFIRQGLILEDATKTLLDWGLGNNSVLHVHVGSPQQGEDRERRDREEDALDLSMLFVPLFGLILGLTWACFFYWPQYFSLLTKIFLTALSLAYVLLTYVTVFA